MIDPTVIEILAAAARAAGPLLERVVGALTEDHREAVLEALARDREALDAAPDVLARVEAAGGTVLEGKKEIAEGYGFMAIILDTEGNRVALHSKK